MKLLNKKGFMMVESLIVTTFVLALFIVVYRNVIPQMGEYDKMYSYDDIDSVYAGNLLKRMITRHGNTIYIDNYLQSNTYLELMDCDNKNLYVNSDYCKTVMENIGVTEKDYVFITKYNISEFRQTVKSQEKFDSGNLSNFRDYINTVSNEESFYSKRSNEDQIGKYRIFVTRTVNNADGTTTLKYTNLGIYGGKYDIYRAGDKIEFDPGDGTKRTFIVLKDSPSDSDTVTMILDRNIGTSAYGEIKNTSNFAGSITSKLINVTSSWSNAIQNHNYNYYVNYPEYSINYKVYYYFVTYNNTKYFAQFSDHYARLLEAEDVYNLSTTIHKSQQFTYNNLFSIPLDEHANNILAANLTGDEGYWMVNPVINTTNMAWVVKNGKIVPMDVGNTSIGIRPVITVLKDNLK